MMPSHDFKLRVVVIDDDEQHLKFIATALTQENIVVSTSGTRVTDLSSSENNTPTLS